MEDEDGVNLELRNDADQQANQDDVHSIWPPNDEQFIIESFTDGIFPGEVIEVIGNTVRAVLRTFYALMPTYLCIRISPCRI